MFGAPDIHFRMALKPLVVERLWDPDAIVWVSSVME